MSIEDVEKDVRINFRVPESYREQLKEHFQGRTLSKWFRRVVEDELGITNDSPLSSKSLDYSKDTEVVAFRVSKDTYSTFKTMCDALATQPRKAMRGFLDKTKTLQDNKLFTGDSVPLFYAFLFIIDTMERQYLHLVDVKETPGAVGDFVLTRDGDKWQVVANGHQWTLFFSN